MLQHSLMNESARAPTYDAPHRSRLAYLSTQTLNVISGESTVGESTVASALQWRRSLSYACCTDLLSSLVSKFSNGLSRWESEYASWLKIGILNSSAPAL